MTVSQMDVTGTSAMKGMVVALMVASGFTEHEFTAAQRAIAKAGATLKTISCDNGLVNGWDGTAFGHYFPVDAHIGEVLAADLDALVVIGGDRSIAKLKNNLNTGRIIRNMVDGYKPVVLFGAASELLAQAGREPAPHVLAIANTSAESSDVWTAEALDHMIRTLAPAQAQAVAA